MAKFTSLAYKVIKQADLILIVVDALKNDIVTHQHIIDVVQQEKKPYIIVYNKADLLPKKMIAKPNEAYVSSTNRLGTLVLLRKIMKHAKEEITVGVVGLPNSGKSSLINALKGSQAARTSPISGFTRSLQKVRISRKVMLLDSPGVFDSKLPEAKKIKASIIDVDRIKDPEVAAVKLMEELDGKIESYYDVPISINYYDTLESIAIKKHIIGKGKEPDTERMAREIIRLWQKGKIR
jgi:ribosome biogenesis GTPase A